MKIYVIPPVASLDLIRMGDRAFCLTQLYISSEEYRNYFKKLKAEGWWITMDSGIGDHNPVTQDQLFEAMKDLMPSEVIPVDTLFNKDETIKNLDNFVDRMAVEDLLSEIEIFGCPQGTTKDEWLECYSYMLNNPFVSTIGLSKITVPFVWLGKKDDEGIAEARNMCYDYLVANDLLKKPIHCLGQGDPREFAHYTNPLMRSTDSCYTILAAMNDIKFKEGNYTRIKTPRDYFERSVTPEQVLVARDNVDVLRSQFKVKQLT